jgi:hypothetical protein
MDSESRSRRLPREFETRIDLRACPAALSKGTLLCGRAVGGNQESHPKKPVRAAYVLPLSSLSAIWRRVWDSQLTPNRRPAHRP